jgi:hypothetical protein
MKLRGPTARRNSPPRHVWPVAVAAAVLTLLTGCATASGAALRDDTVLVGIAILVAGFVLTQITSILRDVRDALALIGRAIGSLAVASLLLIAGAVALMLAVVLAILNG